MGTHFTPKLDSSASSKTLLRQLQPRAPRLLVGSDGEQPAVADQRKLQQHRLLAQLLNPPFRGQHSVLQSKIEEAARGPVEQRFGAEFLREPLQLSDRGRSYGEIHKMRLDSALGKESQCLSGIGALVYAEHLNFHG